MNRLQRLHAIGERLRSASPGTIPARALAEEFEVSRRTIERDLDALRLAGAAIWGQPGRSGGVGIVDGPRRLIALSDADIAALVVAAHAVGGAPFAANARRAAETLVGHASDETRASVDSVRSVVLLAESDAVDVRTRRVVEDAVIERRQLNLTYRDRNGDVTRRRVDPVGFLNNGGTWSLVAYCHLRAAGRLFRLERIQRAAATRRTAARHDLATVLGDVPFATRPPR